MQGKLPCDVCPYDYKCEECLERKARKDPMARFEKGGFFSQEVRQVIGPDGKKVYTYSHPE